MILSIDALIIGLVVGSFLNVCIWRLPRQESIVSPSSHCPSCNRPVAVYDNIPVLSYLILGGKCRNCKTRISWRYPLVELINGLGYAGLVWRYGLGWPVLIYAVLFSALVVITFIDLDHQIIPNVITYPGMVIGLGTSVIMPVGFLNSVIGFLVGGGILYLVAEVFFRILKQEAMGGGDIKMIAMLGAFFGWKSVLFTLFLGALSGSVIGLGLIAFKGLGRRTPIPFGPFLCMAAVLFMFRGPEIIEWYRQLAVTGF